jgi:hypothetical protein
MHSLTIPELVSTPYVQFLTFSLDARQLSGPYALVGALDVLGAQLLATIAHIIALEDETFFSVTRGACILTDAGTSRMLS